MPLVVQCPKCLKPAQVAEKFAGQPVRCPACQHIFTASAARAPEPVAVGAASRPSSPSLSTPPPPVSTSPSVSRAPAAPPAPVGPAPGPTKCPSCGAALEPGVIACLDCGWVRPDEVSADSGVPPVLCTNPACGVANPPGEKHCQRCNTLLPTPPGTVLHGRYKLDRLIAMGGFGAVYLASDVKANRKVAIKDMICEDPQEFNIRLQFFRREADILRTLESVPIVPRVYDFIHQDKSAHLVLEFIPGQDLLKIMEANNNRPFPLDTVIEWGKLLCDVLQVMHSQNPPIVHRDVKPDNVMLLEDGRKIKMIDFGTARDMGRTHKTRLQAKTRVFTEGYAPPEQIIGKPEARSDIYALAGTLYHLATGKAPEGFYTAKELDEQLKGPNGSIPMTHRWFFEIIKINLSEDANDRYFSAAELKRDLEQRRVTTEVRCPACQHANRVREPYCARCANALTEPTPPCNHCGKVNRMGSRCCIHCGNRLR